MSFPDITNTPEFRELLKIYKEYPDKVMEVFRQDENLRKQIFDLWDILSAGESVSVDGFKVAYREFYGGREFPYVDIPVAEQFVWAFDNKKGVLYEKWRGGGKSTYFAAWCPYLIGVRPVGSTSLVRINDSKAKEMGSAIATLIMTNPGWKKIFPHVIPDERAGWSVENGFNVMDTRVTGPMGKKGFEERYAQWRMMCFADHLSEKSLLCAGIESGSLIGLHSSNGMWFDDLHDEQNTRSVAEMAKVVAILEGNIIGTWFSVAGSPTLGVFCTPWSKNPPDAYQVMLKTGLFKHIKMPIYVEDENGETIPTTITDTDGIVRPIDPEYAGKKVKLTWPELFPVTKVAEMIYAYKTRFGQMCLLDISLSAPKNMRYMDFPHKDIKWDQWWVTDGVDPVGTVEGISKGSGISHFALAHFLKTPYNTLVIGGGIVEKCDAIEGEQHVLNSQRRHRNYRGASIELNGSGAMFVALLTRNKGVKYNGHEVKEIGPGNKRQRQYRFLQPLFASGSIQVSDNPDDPFLIAVREYLDNFPNFDSDSYLWDVGDALAIGALDHPEIWTKIVTGNTEFWAEDRRSAGADPYAALLEGRR